MDFFKSDKKYYLLIAMCFLYAGFALLSFSFTVYTEVVSQPSTMMGMDNNIPDFNINRDLNSPDFRNPNFRRVDYVGALFGASALNYLIGGLVSLFSGMALSLLVMKKSKKQITHGVVNTLLLPDEKIIFNLLAKSSDGLTQSRLNLETGFGKVKVSRIIKKLEEKGIIEKSKYGLTNKIFIKEKI
jgi:hypothetical protein